MYRFFKDRVDISGYDKYKTDFKSDEHFNQILTKDIVFLCLPTLYEDSIKQYDKSSIIEVCIKLSQNSYPGAVVLKSTVEPGTTEKLTKMYPNLTIIHNPEFLTARTCDEDFAKQTHIVLGKPDNCNHSKYQKVEQLFRKFWPKANYSFCSSTESESMKIFCNSFYAMKIGIFNEFYKLCRKTDQNFTFIKEMMLKNNWINEMHTNVPGPDGKSGYGGACFPKDTKALLHHMKRMNTDCAILDSCDQENDEWRKTSSGEIDYY